METGDEKRVQYGNVQHNWSCCLPSAHLKRTVKPDSSPKKVTFSTWWDWKGVLLSKMLTQITSISAQLHSKKWIVWPVRSVASTRIKVLSAIFTSMSDHNSQTAPSKSCLSWAGKYLSTHQIAQTLRPPTIICSCSWETSCDLRRSPTKMTSASG